MRIRKGSFWAEENLVVNNKSNRVFLSWDASANGCHFKIDVCFSIKAQPANICFNWNVKSLWEDYQWFVPRQKHSTVKVVIREQEAGHPSTLLVPKPRAAAGWGTGPGGVLKYNLGGYVPPGSPKKDPVLERFCIQNDTPF